MLQQWCHSSRSDSFDDVGSEMFAWIETALVFRIFTLNMVLAVAQLFQLLAVCYDINKVSVLFVTFFNFLNS